VTGALVATAQTNDSELNGHLDLIKYCPGKPIKKNDMHIQGFDGGTSGTKTT
jgi:hypothetical protein